MKIVAAVLDHVGVARPYSVTRPLRLAELDLDDPRPGELLVRIDAAGLCHSDLSVVNGARPRPIPMALGHEAAATVVRTGESGSAFAPGDKLVLTFLPACGQCVACGSGQRYICRPGAAANGEGRLLLGGRRLHEGGTEVQHHLGVSAFATHAVVDQRSVVKVDPDIAPEIAALFGCAVLTGVGAVVNTAAARPGESVAIFGLGGVGLAALLGAVAVGGNPVIAVDPVEEKRALALELGASAAVAPEAAAEVIARMTAGEGVDVAIETAGKGAVLAAAYAATRRGGRMVTVSLPPASEQLPISALSLVADGKTVFGSFMGSCIPIRDVPRFIGLWRKGRLPVERLLTNVSPLSEINARMEDLAAGRAVRQIVLPHA